MTTIDAAIHSIRTTDSMLSARTAIALLVADEVSLRLAAAPTLEDAIGALERSTYAHGKVTGTPAGLDLAAARERDRNALRTAITAHVEAEIARRLACAPGVEEAMTDLLGQVGCAAHHRDELADALRAAISADKARVTPDEARRLVTEHRIAVDALGFHGGQPNPKPAETFRLAGIRDDTEYALLRALGVEA